MSFVLRMAVREIRASVSELRGVTAQGRALHGEMVWTRQHQRATAFVELAEAVFEYAESLAPFLAFTR